MLKFTRHKLASVYRKDEQTLAVHGILEDDIYGMEIDLDLDLASLEILSVQGKWNRMENSECPRAIPFLQEAVGLRMDDDFARKVQKSVGRKACRHFADLILECCQAAKDAARVIHGREVQVNQPDAKPAPFDKPCEPVKDVPLPRVKENVSTPEKSFPGGMIIDLHTHSFPASPCSTLSVQDLIKEAKSIGLDGICLTDHNYLWDPGKVEELRQQHGFLVLRGCEITTEQGDILVFGLEEKIAGVIQLAELREKVLRSGGFMIAAHPFRGFLTFGMSYLGLTREKAMARPAFKLVDAVEVLNCKVSGQENNFAAEVAGGLGLPVTGGSDAHGPGEVGLYATQFTGQINNEKELVEALHAGGYTPITFRNR